jgi:hypothetical protein
MNRIQPGQDLAYFTNRQDLAGNALDPIMDDPSPSPNRALSPYSTWEVDSSQTPRCSAYLVSASLVARF